jgi:hypothetical protein
MIEKNAKVMMLMKSFWTGKTTHLISYVLLYKFCFEKILLKIILCFISRKVSTYTSTRNNYACIIRRMKITIFLTLRETHLFNLFFSSIYHFTLTHLCGCFFMHFIFFISKSFSKCLNSSFFFCFKFYIIESKL